MWKSGRRMAGRRDPYVAQILEHGPHAGDARSQDLRAMRARTLTGTCLAAVRTRITIGVHAPGRCATSVCGRMLMRPMVRSRADSEVVAARRGIGIRRRGDRCLVLVHSRHAHPRDRRRRPIQDERKRKHQAQHNGPGRHGRTLPFQR